MTDITELAQSLKAAANKAGADDWQAKKISGDFYVIRKGSYSSQCGYRTYQPIAEIDHKPTRDYVAIANPANILALVEALEKAQTINAAAEKLVRCKGRYHSEQNYRALAALFGVITPDLPPLDGEPVAWMVIDIDTGERIIRCDRSYIEGSCQPLYRHAQPVRVVPDDYQRLRELYHAQEKRLFKIAQRIKGPAFDKYSHSPSQAIDVLEGAIFGENDACRAAMLQAGSSPVIPDGYVMVPKEPTAQMYDAGDRQMTTKQVWDAMLAVATQEAK